MSRLFVVATATLGLLGAAFSIETAAAGPSCTTALNTLMDKWNAVGYQMPQKPSQARVLGKDGHETTGPQYNYMRSQINMAAQACSSNDDTAALQHINLVQNLLDGPGHSNSDTSVAGR